jgi:diguanylate cyclase (GGDEF)-like protein
MATTSFIARSIGAAGDRGQRVFARCTMRAPTNTRVQEPSVTSDAPTSDPRIALADAIADVAAAADLDAALSVLLGAAADVLHPMMGAILIQDPDRAGLVVAASVGIDEAAQIFLNTAVADPMHPFVVAATDRTSTFDREATTPDGAPFVGAYLPLLVWGGGVEVSLGSIGFGWAAPRVLTDPEREALAGFAGLAALTVDRSRLASTASERSEWFERMAHSDPLTGLANERTVGRVLELELARAGRHGSEVSFLMFDIDDFRATNRDLGHPAGDDVLRQVAAVLAESVRLVDTVGRIGGDEFVVIAPGSAGQVVAERVLAGIAALPAVAGKLITVSAGVSRFPVDGADPAALIASTTAALAKAKEDGGGKITGSPVTTEG